MDSFLGFGALLLLALAAADFEDPNDIKRDFEHADHPHLAIIPIEPTPVPTFMAPNLKPLATKQPTLASKPKQQTWNSFRLPTTVTPIQYNLSIVLDIFNETDMNASIPYNGAVDISVDLWEAVNLVVLNAVNLNISRAQVSEPGELYEEVKLKKKDKLQQVHLILNKQYDSYTTLNLKLEFTSKLSNSLQGFYKSAYKLSNGEKRMMATTQFESVFARHAFPCFDDPSFKAKFRLTITRPKGWKSLFNAPLLSTRKFDEKRMLDTYGTSPVMSSYLVAFVVADLSNTAAYNITSKLDGHTIDITVHGSEEEISQLEFAKTIAGDIVLAYEEFFQVAYPLGKLDMVAIPDFGGGGMENWGLITFRSEALLHKNSSSSSEDLLFTTYLIAHELAHQWFGNLVTMKWWNELWLNEGFATFVGYMIGTQHISDKYGYNWPVVETFRIELVRALEMDALPSTPELSQPADLINSLADIESKFDDITYEKGAAILLMLDAFVTRNVTKAALRNYLSLHKYANAEAVELWNSFDKAYCKENAEREVSEISEMMSSWTNRPGYPLVSTAISNGGGEVKVNQSQLLICTTCDRSPHKTLWTIPITYEMHGPAIKEIKQDNLHRQEGHVGSRTGSWAKLNHNWEGYYVTKYEHISRINILELGDIDQANLVFDATILFRGGQIEPHDFVNLLRKIVSQSTGYLTWRVTLKTLQYLLITFDQQYDDYVKISSKVFDFLNVKQMNLTYKSVEAMNITDRIILTHKLALALTIDHNRVAREALGITELSTLWAKNLKNDSYKTDEIIHKDITRRIGTLAFLLNETDLWDTVWSKYMATGNPSQHQDCMYILASGNDVMLLRRLLDYALNHGKHGETVEIIALVAMNRRGRALVWDFIRTNWATLTSRYGTVGFTMRKLIYDTTRYFSEETRLTQMKEFFNSNLLQSGQRSANQALEVVQSNVDMVTKKSEELVAEFMKIT